MSLLPTEREALQMCADRFREYERLHRAKGTDDATEKAERNAEMADMCELVLKGRELSRPPIRLVASTANFYPEDAPAGAIEWTFLASKATPVERGCSVVNELVEALTALVDETVDYMRINKLGDPQAKHNIKRARAALAKATGQ